MQPETHSLTRIDVEAMSDQEFQDFLDEELPLEEAEDPTFDVLRERFGDLETVRKDVSRQEAVDFLVGKYRPRYRVREHGKYKHEGEPAPQWYAMQKEAYE